MPPIFEILHKACTGRLGRLETRHMIVETPTIMPVVKPNIQTIKPGELRKFGAEILITNSYIIYRRPDDAEELLKKTFHT